MKMTEILENKLYIIDERDFCDSEYGEDFSVVVASVNLFYEFAECKSTTLRMKRQGDRKIGIFLRENSSEYDLDFDRTNTVVDFIAEQIKVGKKVVVASKNKWNVALFLALLYGICAGDFICDDLENLERLFPESQLTNTYKDFLYEYIYFV